MVCANVSTHEAGCTVATMVDVAKRAGVSISTVSHVLNGTRNVEPATRRKVLAAIEEIGYRQDALARAMRRSRSDSIGLIVSDAGEPAFAEMAHGVEQAAADNGLTLLLANSAEDANREHRAITALMNRRVDGLILACSANTDIASVGALDQERAPVVLLDRLHRMLPFDQVGADNRGSMRALVNHLAKLGHRRLAVLAGDTRVPTLTERLEGFYDGLRDSDLSEDDHVVLEGTNTAEILDRATTASKAGVSAVIACSTPLAVIGLNAIQSAGLHVPTQIAFATFDGFRNPELFQPRITTVHQPAYEMGMTAVQLLLARLSSPKAGPRTVRLQQSIELRDSTEAFNFTKP